MTLHEPFAISARLLPGVRVGDDWISLEYSPRPGREGRARYRYHIDTADWEYTGEDLQSGCGGGTLQEGFASLLSFLSACAEAQRYPNSDNRDLFPPHVAAWAAQHSSEIDCLAFEIEQAESELIEA